MIHVVLVEPEIPPNTGNIGRLCLATGSRLHLVGPLGFDLDDRTLKRAGLDYWKEVDVHRWDSLEDLRESAGSARFFFLTTKATKPYWDVNFEDGDYLVFGRETKGLPESLLDANAESCLTIPMKPAAVRSLNLATSVGIVLYEALRSSGWKSSTDTPVCAQRRG
ncbi:MAG: tRNA (uridine(34)/cytosine(34)/5-carboxymethylaminomethyluridine(34)-2'-O)-methyltransferase TrmL [Verrucomicrobiota bacterium]